MAYDIVNGTNANNFIAFHGVVQTYNQTLVNPYSGYTVTITGTKNVNNAIYDGQGGTDTLSMTAMGDVLTLTDQFGTIMVKNIETFQANDDGDVVILADATLLYGNVTIRGAEGDDLLWSNSGDDLIFGGNGADIMDGGAGNDQLFGGNDNDYVAGGKGSDLVFGGAGDDTLMYNVDGTWSGGYTLASLNSAIPFAAMINLDGLNRSYDTFNGDADETYTVSGARGIDTLIMTSGNDVLVASDVVSPVNSGLTPRVAEIEIIEAGDGNDIVDLSGTNNIDVTIHGGNGDDILAGSNGNDTITGDAGNDRIFGSTGNDTLSGGTGDDTYYYRAGDGSDTIIETSGDDSISFGPGITLANLIFTTVGTDLQITVGTDTITIQNQFAADLSGRVENLLFADNSIYNLGVFGPPAAPVANTDTFNGNEDIVITGNVLTNDTDANGDALTVTAQTFTTAQGGSVVLNGDGSFSYTGASNYNGADSFTYTANDGNGHSTSGTVNLTIAAVNDAPVAGNTTFSGDEDQTITGNLLSNAGDVDGDALNTTAQTIATAHGNVTINADGTFSYAANANYHGADSFDYTVNDGNGGSSTATATLNIASVNDAPVANADTFNGNEDEIITGNVLANDTDVDGDILTATAQTIVTAHGNVTINADGSFSYAADNNFNGIDSFDYTVDDGHGGTATATATLTIGAVNDGPVADNDTFNGNEDQPITGNVLSNDIDVDGDILTTVAQTIATAHGNVTINADGTFSYQADANYNGSDSFNYTVRDSSGATDVGTVLLGIAAVNDAPVAQDDSFNGLRNAVLNGNVLGNDSDIDGDTLSVHAATMTTAQGGTVTLHADGTFSYTGADGFYGHDSFDYTALDGNGGFDTATVSLNIALDSAHSIIGSDTGETINGTSGNDEIFAQGGDDTVKGQDGNDAIFGGDGNDILYGDDSILTGMVYDKQFADTIVIPKVTEGVNITTLRPKGDPALGINAGNLTVDYQATATVTFRKGYAGNDNSFGVFGVAADGTIVQSTMAYANVKTAGIDIAHDIALPVGVSGGAFGFFIIADGNNANGGYSGLNITGAGNIKFVYDYGLADQRDAKITDAGSKVSVVYDDGHTVKVLQGSVYFTTDRGASTAINEDGKTHVVSGLMDSNNLSLDPKAADLASKPVTYTSHDITVTALSGTLIGHGNSIGIKSSASGDTIAGTESLHIGLASGADKVTVSLSDIAGNNTGIDFKIYLDGDTTHPVSYEYVVTGNPAGGLVDIVLNGADFGGHITGLDISSIANSSHGTESFYLDNINAEIPGGTDTNTLRIGFEDLYNTGDADYEDVLFDLDIKPVTLGDSAGGNDYLDGGAGNDTLYGEGGNDILVIGLGLDHATGGLGADTFALKNIDANVDVIHDFNRAEGDVLNITDVLEGFDPLHDDISHFVHLVQSGADTQVQINADGHDGGAFVTAALILGGVGGESLGQLMTESAIVANQSVTHS